VSIDFLRQSQDGRMTLVLSEVAKPVRSLWAQMASTDLAQAREDLCAREGAPKSSAVKHIGTWSRGDPAPRNVIALGSRAEYHCVDQVVWTELLARFDGEEGRPGFM
jgi:hypothetical protein